MPEVYAADFARPSPCLRRVMVSRPSETETLFSLSHFHAGKFAGVFCHLRQSTAEPEKSSDRFQRTADQARAAVAKTAGSAAVVDV